MQARAAAALRTAVGQGGRFLPAVALVAAAALFVGLAPSRPPAIAQAIVRGLGAAGPGGAGQAGAAGAGAAAAGGAGAAAGGAAATAAGGAAGVAASTLGHLVGPADCSRLAIMNTTVLGGGTCRPGHWVGGNGGATYAGVTATTINVVVYRPAQNAAVQAALQQAGQASQAQDQDAMAVYENYFNTNYEYYGRKVHLIWQQGPAAASTTDPAEQQSDATYSAIDNHAFAVAALTAPGPYAQELARRGVVNSDLTLELRESQFNQLAPYTFGFLQDLDTQMQEVAEYYCKRLSGRNATHAGDPTYQSSKRRIGIIWLDTFQDAGTYMQSLLQRCNANIGKVISYDGATASLAEQATNLVTQMHQDGDTTVTCICDPVSPAVFTQQATNQGWEPEWIENSIDLQDAPTLARLYDQTQMSHTFGIAQDNYNTSSCGAAWYLAFKAGSNGGDPTRDGVAGATLWVILAPLLEAIERAGPILTASSLASAMLNFPATTGPSTFLHLSFGNHGPSPLTQEDDLTEVWWSGSTNGPDGKAGAWYFVNKGVRYSPGAWPSGDPDVFDTANSSPEPMDPC